MSKLDPMSLDKRLRDLNLKRGQLLAADLEKHLKSLPDDADRAEELKVYEEEAEGMTDSTLPEVPSLEAPENTETS